MSNVTLIKDLLRNTDKKFTEIAAEAGVSSRTVQNINKGLTHKRSDETYPIRFTGRQTGELREKLSKPNKNAVPRPHVLSPQLLDYIGFLSLMGAEIDCLLVFKDVYYKQLKKVFNRDLSDDEILSIIKLSPEKPPQLQALIQAYKKPSVKLINTDYWLSTGLISVSEKDILHTLLL